jgi:hypothetical protein
MSPIACWDAHHGSIAMSTPCFSRKITLADIIVLVFIVCCSPVRGHPRSIFIRRVTGGLARGDVRFTSREVDVFEIEIHGRQGDTGWVWVRSHGSATATKELVILLTAGSAIRVPGPVIREDRTIASEHLHRTTILIIKS